MAGRRWYLPIDGTRTTEGGLTMQSRITAFALMTLSITLRGRFRCPIHPGPEDRQSDHHSEELSIGMSSKRSRPPISGKIQTANSRVPQ